MAQVAFGPDRGEPVGVGTCTNEGATAIVDSLVPVNCVIMHIVDLAGVRVI